MPTSTFDPSHPALSIQIKHSAQLQVRLQLTMLCTCSTTDSAPPRATNSRVTALCKYLHNHADSTCTSRAASHHVPCLPRADDSTSLLGFCRRECCRDSIAAALPSAVTPLVMITNGCARAFCCRLELRADSENDSLTSVLFLLCLLDPCRTGNAASSPSSRQAGQGRQAGQREVDLPSARQASNATDTMSHMHSWGRASRGIQDGQDRAGKGRQGAGQKAGPVRIQCKQAGLEQSAERMVMSADLGSQVCLQVCLFSASLPICLSAGLLHLSLHAVVPCRH